MYLTGLIGSIQQLETANAVSIPGQVTGLTAAPHASSVSGKNLINLSWNAVSGADTYFLERSDNASSGFSQLGFGIAGTSAQSGGLTPATRFYFRVRASNTAGNGAYSSVANAWTKPAQVTGLTATATSSSQINLSWNNPGGTVTGYKVFRGTNAITQTQIATPTGTTFSSTGLSNSTTYYFRVQAVNDGGDGQLSSVVNATTQAASGPPTNVTIRHANGGTLNTCLGECITLGSLGENALDDIVVASFSSSQATADLTLGVSYSAQVNNNSGALTMEYYAYMDATGATSFEWDVYAFSIGADRTSAVSSWGATGTAATSQNGTGGLGENATLQHNSGGRGYLLLQKAGFTGTPVADNVTHKIRGLATNSDGTVSTTQLLIKWECV